MTNEIRPSKPSDGTLTQSPVFWALIIGMSLSAGFTVFLLDLAAFRLYGTSFGAFTFGSLGGFAGLVFMTMLADAVMLRKKH